MKLHRDKSIGRVLFIVEGEKTEFNLLKRIFCEILNYNFIKGRRSNIPRFVNKSNANSTIAVVNTSSSNIASVSDVDYLDKVFTSLIDECDFPVDKSAIFFLFDRDPKSNKDSVKIEEFIDVLKDPYDNDEMQAGLLLLNYPSIEAFIISNFDETQHLQFGLGAEAKNYVCDNKYMQFNKISEQTLLYATNEFIAFIDSNYGQKWVIDDISIVSKDIFIKQEEHYTQSSTYKLFSMLVAAFLYLGIIEL